MDDDAAFAEEVRKEIAAIRLKVDTYIHNKETCASPVLSLPEHPKGIIHIPVAHLPTSLRPMIETVLKKVCMKAEEVLDRFGTDAAVKWCEDIINPPP